MSAPARAEVPRATRIDSAIGLLALLPFVAFHLGEVWSSLRGRASFSSTMNSTAPSGTMLWVRLGVVLLPIAAHVLLSARRAVRRDPREDARYGGAGLRRLQAVTGILLLAFLVLHAMQVMLPRLGGADAGVAYDILRAEVGKPAELAAYGIGIAALAFHLVLGIVAAFGLRGNDSAPEQMRARWIASALVGLVLWFGYLDVASHFAGGAAWIGPRPPAEVVPDGPRASNRGSGAESTP